MNVVLNERCSTVIHTAGTITGASSDNNRDAASNIEYFSNNNNCALSENELPDINETKSEKSYSSNLSHTGENEIFDKTPEFDSE
jgi:hypothetical protein